MYVGRLFGHPILGCGKRRTSASIYLLISDKPSQCSTMCEPAHLISVQLLPRVVIKPSASRWRKDNPPIQPQFLEQNSDGFDPGRRSTDHGVTCRRYAAVHCLIAPPFPFLFLFLCPSWKFAMVASNTAKILIMSKAEARITAAVSAASCIKAPAYLAHLMLVEAVG